MLTNLACPISRLRGEWDYTTGLRFSDVVETVTFETETWLKFQDETETSSKTSRPRLHQKLRDRDRDSRLEVRDRDSRLQNLCILPKFFKNMSSFF